MQKIHPLDRLVGDDSLFFLEAMIPFVDYNTKKLLVILIKYREINSIMNSLNDPVLLSECGFDKHPKSTEDFISDLCFFMPDEIKNNIKQATQMMSMMKVVNAMDSNNMQQKAPNNSCENSSKSSLYENVMSILNNE